MLKKHHTVTSAGVHRSVLGEKLVMSPRDPMSCLEAAAEARNLVVFRREVVSWGCLKYIRSCEHCFAKRGKKSREAPRSGEKETTTMSRMYEQKGRRLMTQRGYKRTMPGAGTRGRQSTKRTKRVRRKGEGQGREKSLKRTSAEGQGRRKSAGAHRPVRG